MVETREADKQLKIQELKNSKEVSIEKLKVKFQTSDKLKNSFSIIAIVVIVFSILVIITPDIFKILCYCKKLIRKKPVEKIENQVKLIKNARNHYSKQVEANFKLKIDKLVLNFELKNHH